MTKPGLLHLGGDIIWNYQLYKRLEEIFDIKRSFSMDRYSFLGSLRSGAFGNFVAIYRPHWGTGGEMGKWDEELM